MKGNRDCQWQLIKGFRVPVLSVLLFQQVHNSRMRRIGIFTCICLSLVFMTACSASSKKEDADWVFDSIEKFNQEKVRQFTLRKVTKTEKGIYEKEGTTTVDSENNLIYVNTVETGPAGYRLYNEIYFFKEDEAWNAIVRYDSTEEFQNMVLPDEAAENVLPDVEVSLSDECTAEIIGEETIGEREAVKVTVIDSGVEPLPQLTESYETIKAQGAFSDTKKAEAAIDEYVNQKEEKWTFWFDKKSHELVQSQYDGTTAARLMYYLSGGLGSSGNEMPVEKVVTFQTSAGGQCKKIELPDTF